MVNPLDAVTAIAQAVANVSKEIAQRDAEHNTAEMVATRKLDEIQKIIDQHRAAIAGKSLEEFRKSVAKPAAVLAGLIGLMGLMGLTGFMGCGTVAPKPVQAKQASLDAVADGTGNYQNSGVLGYRTNGNVIITPGGRETYRALIVKYGNRLTPAVTNLDYGLVPYTDALVRVRETRSFARTTELWEMDPPAQEAWGTLTTLANAPTNKPP